ncbi:MAG: GNAT family protein [Pseudomonadota bacterium]
MSRLSFRTADPEDYHLIADIWDKSWKSTGVESPEKLSVTELAARLEKMVLEGASLYSVTDEETVIGLILLIEADRCLSQVFLAPDQQGQGYGPKCLEFIQEQLPEGFWLSVAEGNQGAIRFYERNGLRRERRKWRPEYERFDLYYVWDPAPQK